MWKTGKMTEHGSSEKAGLDHDTSRSRNAEIEAMKRTLEVKSQLSVLTLFFVLAAATGRADDAAVDQKQREADFVAKMANTTLTGSFTVDSNMEAAPKQERYEIESVTKVTGNLWTFNTRIKYGDTDARLPVTVPVVWADGTPMVALTDATIPGMGSEFSARVIFHGDRYAGTWQHGPKGGHLFGTIKKTKKADAKPVEK